MKNRIKIYTLGCKVNQYDSRSLETKFSLLGFKSVKDNADFVVLNTCAVTKKAITKARSVLSRAKKENKQAQIFVTGCWPEAYPGEARELCGDNVFGIGEADELLKTIKKISGIKNEQTNKNFSVQDVTDKARYAIKIQDGCEQFCSYCIIPFTRGKLKSREEKEILNEAAGAIDKGFKELVISGIHLGLYGVDKNTNLLALLKKMLELPGLGRIRLSSIEIGEVSNGLIDLIFSNHKICDHLHVPLQSGSDKILRLMNRPYDGGSFMKKIVDIKKRVPGAALTTDVIVGFPGESDDDFNSTYKFINDAGFSKLHVFPFSAHKKTPAARMKEQIDSKVVKERAAILRDLGKRLRESYIKGFTGKTMEIVIERLDDKYIYGKCAHYIDHRIERGRLPEQTDVLGKLVKIENF